MPLSAHRSVFDVVAEGHTHHDGEDEAWLRRKEEALSNEAAEQERFDKKPRVARDAASGQPRPRVPRRWIG